MGHATACYGMASPCSASKHNGNKRKTTYPTKIYTDGSKVGGKVGAGVAIYSNEWLVRQCNYRLQNCCFNNQAKQIVILKSLEQLPNLEDLGSRIVAIYTDSSDTSLTKKKFYAQLLN
jgi:hypothetical protein